MDIDTKSKAPSRDLRAFLAFLGSLWGALAALSVAFPLSDRLLEVLPLASHEDDGALVKISPAVFTTLAMIAALFAILWIFSGRSDVTEPKQVDARRSALVAFGAGFLMLIGFLVLYEVKAEDSYDSWSWESDDSRHLLVEVPLVVLYAGFFASVTSAFVHLGLLEFMKGRSES